MKDSRADHEFAQALIAVETSEHGPIEKVEMLVEMALGLQQKPKSPIQLQHAVRLYERALELCPGEEALLAARLRAGKATALRAIPGDYIRDDARSDHADGNGVPGDRPVDRPSSHAGSHARNEGVDPLALARAELEAALPRLREHGASAEEIADAEMSLGVVLHSLAGKHAAKLTDAIAAYQRATRVFNRQKYPREFAILQNNLATAYLSLPLLDERGKLREALAVQAFTEALEVVTLEDDPVEYAMLQNNLGNALQYAASGHPFQNGVRALEAYDEALKVRNARNTPVQYANTLANKANCLRNLPDDLARPSAGNPVRTRQAATLYAEAKRIFCEHGELERAEMVERAGAEIIDEMEQLGEGAVARAVRAESGYDGSGPEPSDSSGPVPADLDFGVSRVSGG